MFALEVEYLMGRVFAGSFRDRSESEWPPHPARLYSALAAAYFEGGRDEREEAALKWLEKQDPPQIRAGAPGAPTRTTAYVPANYANGREVLPVFRGKQPREFPAQAPSEATAYFIWPSADAQPDCAEALDGLASRTAYLGKACSLVRVCVITSAPEPNYVPAATGAHVLRVPSEGRLKELGLLYAADLRPPAGAQQRYVRADTIEPELLPVESEFGHMAVFRFVAGGGLPIEATLTVSDGIRRALMSVADAAGLLTELIHGHNGGTHCAIVPLPFVGREHADGHLMGFAVVLPRAASISERRKVLAACAGLAENKLRIPGVGEWELDEVDALAPAKTLRAATWTRPSRRWKTVTPILLDRFPKKKGPGVEEIISAACRRIGLPSPENIEHGPYSDLAGVPPVPAFRLHRKGEDRPRWGVHATLDFPAPVRGPVLLGAGRYFGLGLLRPWEENNDNR